MLKQQYNQVIIEFNSEAEEKNKNIEKFKKDKAGSLEGSRRDKTPPGARS